MKKKQVLILWFVLLTVVVGYSQSKQTQGKYKPKLTILKNGFIFDDNFELKTGSIIIEDNQIKDLLYADDLSKYPEATIIDITGKYVMPGLIDTHVHLALVAGFDRKVKYKNMEDQLSKMICAGITSVRDMGGDAIILADYKRMSNLNQLPAPSIFYAARFAGADYFNLERKYSKEIDSPWERTITDKSNIRLAVAEAKGAGVTGIKIYSDLSARLVRKIVKEAKHQGLQSWSHAAVFPATPTDATNAKIHSMSHAFDIPYDFSVGKMDHHKKPPAIDTLKLDKLLLLMKKNNVILDATNYIGKNVKLFDGIKVTKRAHELGVKVSTGTDWPYLYEKDNIVPLFKEIKILVDECNFSTKEVLISATKIGAESIGVEDRGVIAIGKRADLYIINSNPLQNIENLKDGFMTVKSGIIYKKE